ncbi:dihydrolipoamide acetyltransferase family protein [Mycetocola reblochoni]|uniref:Dihydrolipoamide acetyltransferase component of pyruvate dehydrogenase complex n=2 Tax=Mycetocola reblochoni TaxID=331618 RepID=A0A1R4JLM5_9MICO|nr:dihydrolipoamide acetyltransferase family protein [Mycetocola reblochoni]RLP68577.1 2-oxo acid dehydrogenase subunit E2 [Mycetocola reblochoni]SJN33151.1 Dihydrolipoamide acetyltransferase component of pyruvate dehydrogenase complex [Mycetocola reblochoni REB411]
MSEQFFTLPDVGEGLTEAEIVSWRVAAGDTVEVNQVIVEIETAKSLVELPSPYAGVVGALLVEEGTTVDVGTAIVRIDGEGDDDGDGAPVSDSLVTEPVEVTAGVETDPDEDAGSGAVLVGYGSEGTAGSRRRGRTRAERRDGASGDQPAARAAAPAAAPVQRSAPSRPAPRSVPAAAAVPVIAKPPIRKLAKDLGVDLTTVVGTGLVGEITRDDVVREASQASVFRNIETPAWKDEREERIPVKGVRKMTASAMVRSAYEAPHVSLFVDVDATRTMEFVKRLKASTDFAGVKVSPLLVVAKAIIWAVRRNPMVNAAWTDEEIIVRHFVNLGVAAATPRGLIVPNVKEAQSMTLLELAQALERLTLTARDGKTPPQDMQGGTITITNIGVFGMDTGTPILNPGEVGIVALGTIKQKPWVFEGEVRPRFVTTLGASFDHRVVDGDVASRFLADVASILEEPALLLD